jgi:flagellar hook-associated protein 2
MSSSVSLSSLGLTGLASGFDTESMIETITKAYQAPIDSLAIQKQTLQTKKDAWGDVNTRLANLLTALSNLKLSATYKAHTVTSSDDTKVIGTATTAAATGTYTIEVSQIAKAHKIASDRLDVEGSGTALNLSGTFQIGGKAVTVAASDSLNSIAEKINDAGAGVTASVMDNRLVIQSNETGAANAIALTDDSETGILKELGVLTSDGAVKNTLVNAQNALFTVDGMTIERAANSISDVISGVTLKLKDETTEKIQLTVATDTDKITAAITAFVNQYNSVMSFIAEKRSYDSETKKGGDLLGDTSLTMLESTLRSMIGANVSGADADYKNLAAIGITTSGKDATLSIDTDKLTAAIEKAPEAVAALFGTPSTNEENGIATRMYSVVNSWTKPITGLLASKDDYFSDRIDDVEDRITALEERLEARKAYLEKQFTNLEVTLSKLYSQSSWLDAQIASMFSD